MKKPEKRPNPRLDYHEGLSINQTKIILNEFGLNYRPFSLWMYGQTCPLVPRLNKDGKRTYISGYYEYDLFRWINDQKRGTPLIWD